MPTVALGLTGGPSEPAASGPTAMTFDSLVDPFTGDFQYSIPLFDLPGPQGSYPFAISYRSGIQTEQEASWVGLGWSFEPGRISRTMRGLPDDVAGEATHLLFRQKEARKIGASAKVGFELLGLDSNLLEVDASIGLEIFFDNYSGYGMALQISPSASSQLGGDLNAKLGVTADLNTQNGATISADLGLTVGNGMGSFSPSYGASFSSATGLESASWGYANVPLFAPTYIAAAQRSQASSRTDFSFKLGAEVWSLFPNGGVHGYYSTSRYSMPASRLAYGYLHLQEALEPESRATAQLDFVREKEGPLKPKTPYLPLSILTHDIFDVATTSELRGSFRAHRKDIPTLGDPVVDSFSSSRSWSLDAGAGALVHFGQFLQAPTTGRNTSSSWLPESWLSSGGAESSTANEPYYFAWFGDANAGATGHADEPRYIQLGSADPTITTTTNIVGLSGSSPDLPPKLSDYEGLLREDTSAIKVRSVTEEKVRSPGERWREQYSNAHVQRPDQDEVPGDRIAGFEVIQPDGTRYFFAQPAYVSKEVNCTFSVDPRSEGSEFLLGQTAVGVPRELSQALEQWIADPTEARRDISLPASTDQFLSCTSTPPYAHSYHLTSVLGVDYVDATGDGPSDDDLGHWVRFEYVKLEDYGYRSPYFGAHYTRGFERSYLTDDRGSFTYGEKEQFVLSRATTASHEALFALSEGAADAARSCVSDTSVEPRSDARGAWSIAQNGAEEVSDDSGYQARLYSVTLCRRGDALPIKTVRFDHDYKLAQGVPNWHPSRDAPRGGKLTLTRLWFEHGSDPSGSRSPYLFHYDPSNPEYQASGRWGDKNADRWGYHQSCSKLSSYPEANGGDGVDRCSNGDEPYTRQSFQSKAADGDGSAQLTESEAAWSRRTVATPSDGEDTPTAWSLRAVTTPSGARVEVDFESDDYAFVQDERASVMVPATVFDSSCGTSVPTGRTLDPQLCVDIRKLGLISDPAESVDDLRERVRSALFQNARGRTSYVAFAADIKLRDDLRASNGSWDPPREAASKPNEMWDRVHGYLEVADLTIDACTADKCEARVHLVADRVNRDDESDTPYHPIAFAGWQHLRLNQPQYGVPGASPLGSKSSDAAQLEEQARILLTRIANFWDIFNAFAANASAAGWASEVRSLNLRLFIPNGKKRGGGVRVRELRICEGLSPCSEVDPALTIGKSYTYEEVPDESTSTVTSSGVAAYEPSLGGDEIALRQPVFFDEERIWAPNETMYFEMPLGESLYPSPVVGYRRIVERTFAGALAREHPELPPLSLAGVRVHEFYTAKEFPVRAEASKIQPKADGDLLPIPGIGSILREKFAASQGYRVELNDMHGKPRRVAEFALTPEGDMAEGADRQTTYFYNVVGDRVDPAVPAVHLRSSSRNPDTLGQRVDYYVDLRESKSSTNSTGMSFNTDVIQSLVPVAFPVPWPSYDDSEKESRTSVFHQIVHRNAVLMAVETKDRSVTTQSENLAFDYRRGTPILRSTTNAFGEPVFDLVVPAYWLHKPMAEDETGDFFSPNQLSADAITLRSAMNPFAASGGQSDGLCCQPSDIATLRVKDVLDASATIFGRRGFVSTSFQNSSAVDGVEALPAWRPLATYRIDDSRRYESSPAPNKDGRFANPVTFPISELPESRPPLAHPNETVSTAFAQDLSAFDELASSCSLSQWKREELFLGYHPRGPTVHSVTPLGRQDAVLYGHRAAVVSAVGRNAGYAEIGFEGFESYASGGSLVLRDLDDGNIDFWTVFDVVPVVRLEERLPGRIHDGVVAWEKPFRQPFVGGDIDPVPPELTIRIDSLLGEPFVLEPRIERMEHRDGQSIAVPEEPLPFSDREVTVEFTRYVKVPSMAPAHWDLPRNWFTRLWDRLTGRRVPKVQVTSTTAHTGTRSLSVKGNATYGQSRIAPKRAGTYVISAWVSRPETDVATFVSNSDVEARADRLGIGVVVGGTVTENSETMASEALGGVTFFFEPVGPIIDGWQRIEGEFQYGTPGENLTMYLQSGGGVFFVDDLRVFPKSASLQTFVYEPRTLRLSARLDDNNLATRWQYDQNGQLRFAERETERGWRTIREHVNHLAEWYEPAAAGGN